MDVPLRHCGTEFDRGIVRGDSGEMVIPVSVLVPGGLP
jgi:hypothetical protein